LRAEVGLPVDPILDVAPIERLRQDVSGLHTCGAILVDDLLRELLPRETVERQVDARGFELRCHAHAEPLKQRDALRVRQQCAALDAGT
jgi:hypothetical protein